MDLTPPRAILVHWVSASMWATFVIPVVLAKYIQWKENWQAVKFTLSVSSFCENEKIQIHLVYWCFLHDLLRFLYLNIDGKGPSNFNVYKKSSTNNVSLPLYHWKSQWKSNPNGKHCVSQGFLISSYFKQQWNTILMMHVKNICSIVVCCIEVFWIIFQIYCKHQWKVQNKNIIIIIS